MSNADIADRLMGLAQLLSTRKENPFKIKAYRRAAKNIATLGDSLEEMVGDGVDLTELPGIGKAIAGAIAEIVASGTSRQLTALRAKVGPEIASLSEFPRLDPRRVLRVYKKLGISTIEELRDRLARGEIAQKLGARMEQHISQALTPSSEVLLYDADKIVAPVDDFLRSIPGVARVESTGAFRRRVETIAELSFLVETPDLPGSLVRMERFAGGTELLEANSSGALFRLPSGIPLRLETACEQNWGSRFICSTGSQAHLEKLNLSTLPCLPAEEAVYRALGLAFIPPELREGRDEIELAAANSLPKLITAADLRGELHAHSTSSDGVHSIEQMAGAARAKGYEYTGISDHSGSLKIAGGVSEEDLRKQLRYIDRLNAHDTAFRILKSSEVDILEDGSLDYPDEILKELDYTVCSIHSRFGLGKTQQTERIMRAMDNRNFTILGHATGRLLLKRPGYEIDIERVIEHARRRGCFFEMNSSPDRLDLSADHARLARDAGIKIAITTDAHSTRDYNLIRCGIDQARRAGLSRENVLNALNLSQLEAALKAVKL